MPCNRLTTNEIAFGEGTDMELMAKAFEATGNISFEYAGGLAFQLRGNSRVGGKFVNGVFTYTEGTDVNAIKRAYSVLSVQATAKKMGWRVITDKNNPLKMQIRKRA